MNLALTDQQYRNKIHPKLFALFVGCASITMMFVAFTSAYIVRQAAGNWLEFNLPDVFAFSAGVIFLSSLVLHAAYIFFKRENAFLYRILLVLGFILGITFIVLQFQGWTALKEMGVQLSGNPSGSFVYVISGIHAAHVLGGISAIFVALVHAFALKFKVTKVRLLRFQLTLTYWHFVDFLWIYLFFFFILQK